MKHYPHITLTSELDIEFSNHANKYTVELDEGIFFNAPTYESVSGAACGYLIAKGIPALHVYHSRAAMLEHSKEIHL